MMSVAWALLSSLSFAMLPSTRDTMSHATSSMYIQNAQLAIPFINTFIARISLHVTTLRRHQVGQVRGASKAQRPYIIAVGIHTRVRSISFA